MSIDEASDSWHRSRVAVDLVHQVLIQERRGFRIGIDSIFQFFQPMPFVGIDKKLHFSAMHLQSFGHLLSFGKRNPRVIRPMDDKEWGFHIFDRIDWRKLLENLLVSIKI